MGCVFWMYPGVPKSMFPAKHALENKVHLGQRDGTDQIDLDLDRLVPHLPSGEVVKELRSTNPSQEACACSLQIIGVPSGHLSYSRSYPGTRPGRYLPCKIEIMKQEWMICPRWALLP